MKDKKMNKKKIDKGDYGYAKKYKNRRIILTLICFACIVADILIGLIMFQTRKTLFTVVACVMSLPFAKNLIGYIMVVAFKPLSKEEHDRTEEIAGKQKIKFLYDISASNSERMLFYPCVAVIGKSVIALIRPPKGENLLDNTVSKAKMKDQQHMEHNKKYEKCLEQINEISKDSYQIKVVSNINEFSSVISRMAGNGEKSSEKNKDEKKLKELLLTIGV
ncbi:hypothetical protein SAMN04487934_101173 [Eubacterium ruminantium]|nr:hypothetical protein SAMN04487934_101173 [Eubacterium ruminantium]